jgi:ABC-type Fe3+-siderophore transport system permease subunit
MLGRNNGLAFKIMLMVLVLITALYTKEYKGEYQVLINTKLGGIFYVLFSSLMFSVLFKRLAPAFAVLLALGLTSLLEFIQYFRFPFMLNLANHKVFAYLFGTSFNWHDFTYYFIGAAVALLLLMLLRTSDPQAIEK